MKETAATAKDAYDTLTTSGTASARELGEAFKKSAEAAIAANNGIAPAWVQAQAAIRGYDLEADRAGKTTLRLRDATDSAAGAHDKATRSINDNRTALERLNDVKEREIAAQEKANQLKERELALYREKWNIDKESFALNTAGNRFELTIPTKESVFNQAKAAGLDEKRALEVADSFDRQYNRPAGLNSIVGGVNPSDVLKAINKAILEAARERVQSEGRSDTTTATNDGRNSTTTATKNSEAQRVVNINISGVAYSVPTNEEGEQNLEAMARGFLRELERMRMAAAR